MNAIPHCTAFHFHQCNTEMQSQPYPILGLVVVFWEGPEKAIFQEVLWSKQRYALFLHSTVNLLWLLTALSSCFSELQLKCGVTSQKWVEMLNCTGHHRISSSTLWVLIIYYLKNNSNNLEVVIKVSNDQFRNLVNSVYL